MEKINIAEILKHCPTGMELDCTMFDNVTFVGVNIEQGFPIEIKVDCDTKYLTKEGCYHRLDCIPSAKCVIFPKGKTTWEGFQIPFKDGDVVSISKNPKDTWIGIFKQYNKTSFESHCSLSTIGDFCSEGFKNHTLIGLRLATEEEKQKLFKVINDNGYKWNSETKTLEKLVTPKFKVGDRVKKNKDYISGIVTDIFDDSFKVTYDNGDCSYVQFHYQCDWKLVPNPKFKIGDVIIHKTPHTKYRVTNFVDGCMYVLKRCKDNSIYQMYIKYVDDEFELVLDVPKFKVGDRIKFQYYDRKVAKIVEISDDEYKLDNGQTIQFKDENAYEIFNEKFDISTLKPFDKVLVRYGSISKWNTGIFSHTVKSDNKLYFIVNTQYWEQCIPYEGNEHLRGTTNDCDEYFKTW